VPAVTLKKEEWDFANIQCAISGGSEAQGVKAQPFALPDFDEVTLKSTIERTKRWGPNRNPIQRSEGRADHEASIKLAGYYWIYFIKRATELGVPLAYLECTFSVSFAKKGQPLKTHTATRCALKEISLEASEGTENIVIDVPLDPMNIFWYGVDVFGVKLNSTSA
jgi:hypothetical protein